MQELNAVIYVPATMRRQRFWGSKLYHPMANSPWNILQALVRSAYCSIGENSDLNAKQAVPVIFTNDVHITCISLQHQFWS